MKFLQTAREKLHKSRSEVAEEIGVSVQTIFRWETGGVTPPVSRLDVISRVYKINTSTLYRRVLKQAVVDRFSGEQLIINVLMQLEAEASVVDESYIIHSFSTRPFLTGTNLDIAFWVAKCASAGVEIAYFCLPSSLSDSNYLKMKPYDTKEALRSQIKCSLEYSESTGKPLDMAEVSKHLWAITSKHDEDLSVVRRIYGNLIKPLTIVSCKPRNENQVLTQTDEHWEKVIPEKFILMDIWININEESGSESDIPQWLQISATHWHHQEYFSALSEIRKNSEFKLSRLMDD